MFDKSAIEELSQAQAITAANDVDGPYIALPSDFKLHDMEGFDLYRRRARGNMSASDMDGFFDYISAHKDNGTTIFAKGIDNGKLVATAVLNLGDVSAPGHADNTATLSIQRTAAYAALGGQARLLDQREAAEFIEDWSDNFQCFGASVEGEDPALIPNKQVIATLRVLTIKSASESTTEVKSLGAARSAFESVAATSKSTIPTLLYFTCVPFLGLPSRQFNLRLGIKTGGDKPMVMLSIINAEKHAEDMGKEFSALLKSQAGDIPVIAGSYSVK